MKNTATKQTFTYSSNEQITNEVGLTGKPIYRRTFTGTTPNNTSDNNLFTITGATKIIKMYGPVQQGGGLNGRVTDVSAPMSGNTAHGPLFQIYPDFTCHVYNVTGDTRWQNMTYAITVEYEK